MSQSSSTNIRKIRTFADDARRLTDAEHTHISVPKKTIGEELDVSIKTNKTVVNINNSHTNTGNITKTGEPITTELEVPKPIEKIDGDHNTQTQQPTNNHAKTVLESQSLHTKKSHNTPIKSSQVNHLEDVEKIKTPQPSILTSRSNDVFDVAHHEAGKGEGTIISDTKRDRWKFFPALKAAFFGWAQEKKEALEESKKPKHTIERPEVRKAIIQKAIAKKAEGKTDTESIEKRIKESSFATQSSKEILITESKEPPKPQWTYIVDEDKDKNTAENKLITESKEKNLSNIPKVEVTKNNTKTLESKEEISLDTLHTDTTNSQNVMTNVSQAEIRYTKNEPLAKPDTNVNVSNNATKAKQEGFAQYTSIPSVEKNLQKEINVPLEKGRIYTQTTPQHIESARPSASQKPKEENTFVSIAHPNDVQNNHLSINDPDGTEKYDLEEEVLKSKVDQSSRLEKSEELKEEKEHIPNQELKLSQSDTSVGTPQKIQPKVVRNPVPKSRLREANERSKIRVTPKQNSLNPIFLLISGIIAIALGIGTTLWWSGFFDAPTPETSVLPIPSLLRSDATKPIPLLSDRRTLLSEILIKTEEQSNGLVEFYFVDTSDEFKLIETTKTLEVLSFQIPGNFNRTIDSFAFGATEGTPFIVINVRSFDIAFSGMLTWENKMSSDLSPLFGTPVSESKDPLARTVGQTRKAYFGDAIINNDSVRILLDETGNERITYGFIDENTILITTTKEKFESISPLIR